MRTVSLLDRLRRLWRTPEPDHPLSEAEREERGQVPETASDVRSRSEQGLVGEDVDPDEPRSGQV
jgi:hypothetical protein